MAQSKPSVRDVEALLAKLPTGYTFQRIVLVSMPWDPTDDGWNISDHEGTVVHNLKLGRTDLGIFEVPICPALREWFKRYSELVGEEIKLTSYVREKQQGISFR